jgi:hypothetical protein
MLKIDERFSEAHAALASIESLPADGMAIWQAADVHRKLKSARIALNKAEAMAKAPRTVTIDGEEWLSYK